MGEVLIQRVTKKQSLLRLFMTATTDVTVLPIDDNGQIAHIDNVCYRDARIKFKLI